MIDGQEEYEVEELLVRRLKTVASKKKKHIPGGKQQKKQWEYLVVWQGYGPEHNEWINMEELVRNCASLVKKFDKDNPMVEG